MLRFARPLSVALALAALGATGASTNARAQTLEPTQGGSAPRPAPPASDAFLAGYVTAVLERELDLRPLAVEVTGGAVRVALPSSAAADVERVQTLLSDVSDVRSVRIDLVEAEAAAPADGEATPPIAPGGERDAATAAAASAAGGSGGAQGGVEILPRGHLFEPLLADPRWPRFDAAYQRYFDDEFLEDVATVALGGEFPLLRWDGPAAGRMQLGLQGGIFAIFDLDADSKDLINADYRIGLPLTYERGRTSAMARIFHQSSHLGDEFLLRDEVDRVNLSYEALELLGSFRPWQPLRLYGGGGWLFHQEPSDLDPWWVQTGTEVSGARTFLRVLRPIGAVDLQFHDESDFATDLSVRAGVRLESPRLTSQRLAVLLEYYDGRNPNGQFFDRRLEYTGIALQGDF